jgi:2-keto-3-deoxy-L-rhamnonate aldolase RhmA
MTDDDRPVHLAKAILDRLSRAQPVAVLGVRGARTAEIARIARATGHDAIWVDLEHSTMPIDAAATICAAALDLELFPFVRVPEREYGVIGRLLDGGALGIIAPRIETREQAADVVAACRFPPLGHRSAIATLPHVGFQRLPPDRLNERMNRATLVKVLIESPLGIENIESIANVAGVNIVGIGTNDLCAELGVAGDFRNPRVRKAHEAALAACQRARKPLSIGGIGDVAYAAELVRAGAAPLMFTGIDTDLLLTAAQDRLLQTLAALNPPRP